MCPVFYLYWISYYIYRILEELFFKNILGWPENRVNGFWVCMEPILIFIRPMYYSISTF